MNDLTKMGYMLFVIILIGTGIGCFFWGRSSVTINDADVQERAEWLLKTMKSDTVFIPSDTEFTADTNLIAKVEILETEISEEKQKYERSVQTINALLSDARKNFQIDSIAYPKEREWVEEYKKTMGK